MPGLGRLHSPDERDKDFLIRQAIPFREPTRDYRYWWNLGARLDQGDTGTCVGHAWVHYIENGPITHEGTLDAINYYVECTKVDEWSGNDNGDLYFGSSVRAGAKVAQAKGIISEYRWAFSLDEALYALLEVGPLILGTNWYEGMFQPDVEGYVHPTGRVAGGHAYCIDGASRKLRRARILNSWGPHWGRKGAAWISFEDLDRLIKEDGECCLALEVAS